MKTSSRLLIAALFAAGCGARPSMQHPGDGGGGGGGANESPDLAEATTPTDGGVTPTHDLAGTPPSQDLAMAAPHDMANPPPPPPPPPPTKKTLNFIWEGEVQYYMCGPSAARMALSTRMANPPSQQQLAAYMGTTTNGTDYIGLVKGALNHYLNISNYAETDLPNDPPSAAQQAALKQQLVASIDAGYGLVANVVSGWRPPFYPQGGTIYHYIALVGYDLGGDKVMVADPAATGCGDGNCGNPSSQWYNTPKSYWINTSDLGEWIVPKGYTYYP